MLKYSVFVFKLGFFDTFAWGTIAPHSLQLPRQKKTVSPHPSQKSLEQRKEMTFDRRLPNITDLVLRGLYCSFSENLIKKPLQEITANSQE